MPFPFSFGRGCVFPFDPVLLSGLSTCVSNPHPTPSPQAELPLSNVSSLEGPPGKCGSRIFSSVAPHREWRADPPKGTPRSRCFLKKLPIEWLFTSSSGLSPKKRGSSSPRAWSRRSRGRVSRPSPSWRKPALRQRQERLPDLRRNHAVAQGREPQGLSLARALPAVDDQAAGADQSWPSSVGNVSLPQK